MARKKTYSRPNLPQEMLDEARREAGKQASRKARQPVSARETEKNDAVPPAAPQPIIKPPAEQAPKKASMDDLAIEYAYVTRDLRNMGLLAGGLFALLIVLALVL